jgi:hypothetical protein
LTLSAKVGAEGPNSFARSKVEGRGDAAAGPAGRAAGRHGDDLAGGRAKGGAYLDDQAHASDRPRVRSTRSLVSVALARGGRPQGVGGVVVGEQLFLLMVEWKKEEDEHSAEQDRDDAGDEGRMAAGEECGLRHGRIWPV